MNLRGKVYTVFNLRKRFGVADKKADDNTKVIMVNKGSSTIGFIIDKVNEIVNADEKNISCLPEALDNLRNKFVNSVVTMGEKTICLLDLDKTFTISDEDNDAYLKSKIKNK
jgi:purine-binding chemotaxis protein CheW